MINDTITQAILTAAAKPGGFTVQPLGDLRFDAIHKRCNRMAKEGRLFKARITYHVVRFFADKASADEALAKSVDEDARRRERTSALKPKPKMQAPDGPVQYHADYKGVETLPGFERYETRYTQAGAVSFGMQRGRVTR